MKDTSASNRKRYRDLIEAARDTHVIWIAESDDLALILQNDRGEELILVWPSAESAREVISARPNLSQFKPVQRALDRWLGSSTPNLVEDGILVAANPDEHLNCLRVPASSFAKDLSAASALQGKDISRLRRKLVERRRHSGEA